MNLDFTRCSKSGTRGQRQHANRIIIGIVGFRCKEQNSKICNHLKIRKNPNSDEEPNRKILYSA